MGFAATSSGLARRGPKGREPRRSPDRGSPRQSERRGFWVVHSSGTQSLIMSKETFQSIAAVLRLPYGQTCLQHRTRFTQHDQLAGPSLPDPHP